MISRAWRCTPVMAAFERPGREDQGFKASVRYIVSSRLFWDIGKQEGKGKEGKERGKRRERRRREGRGGEGR